MDINAMPIQKALNEHGWNKNGLRQYAGKPFIDKIAQAQQDIRIYREALKIVHGEVDQLSPNPHFANFIGRAVDSRSAGMDYLNANPTLEATLNGYLRDEQTRSSDCFSRSRELNFQLETERKEAKVDLEQCHAEIATKDSMLNQPFKTYQIEFGITSVLGVLVGTLATYIGTRCRRTNKLK